MSVMAISPVAFVSATSLVNTSESGAEGRAQDDTQKIRAQISSDMSSSGSAALAMQAFMAFQPDVQPVASLDPPVDTPQALPVEMSADFDGSTPAWSGGVLNVYA